MSVEQKDQKEQKSVPKRKRKSSAKPKTKDASKKPKQIFKWKELIDQLAVKPDNSFLTYPMSMFFGGKITLEVTDILFHKKGSDDLKITVAYRVHINSYFGETFVWDDVHNFFSYASYAAEQEAMIENKLKKLLGGIKVCDCLTLVDGDHELPCRSCEVKAKLKGILPETEQLMGPNEEEKCCACFEPFTVGGLDIIRFHCSHYLHLNCATKLKQTKCPKCNTAFCHIVFANKTLHHTSKTEPGHDDMEDLLE